MHACSKPENKTKQNSRSNLFHRGICEDNICPICLREEETVVHFSWDCPAASDVWGGSKIKLQKCSIGGGDFRQIFKEVASRCDKEELELFAVVARRLWLRRNDFIHGGNFTHPTQILQDSVKALSDFQKINERQRRQEATEEEERTLWQPPPCGMVKFNRDAAVDAKEKIIGLGIVARDEKGSFLAALSKQLRTDISPVGAETYAALHAIQFCIQQGYSKAWFEGDALQVVKEIRSETPCESMHGHLTEAIKERLQSLDQAIFTHTRREANTAAHELAVRAKTHVIDRVRWTSIPPCICGIVRREEPIPSL